MFEDVFRIGWSFKNVVLEELIEVAPASTLSVGRTSCIQFFVPWRFRILLDVRQRMSETVFFVITCVDFPEAQNIYNVYSLVFEMRLGLIQRFDFALVGTNINTRHQTSESVPANKVLTRMTYIHPLMSHWWRCF